MIRYNNQDIVGCRRWNGTAWEDIKNVRKWNGTAWENILLIEKNIYIYGDQCIDSTGGWGRVINLWPCYGTYTRGMNRYIDYNIDHIYIRTFNWSYNGSVATQNAVDLTYYKKINILFDFYSYESGIYNNGFEWGVCRGPLTDFYDRTNPPKILCSGYEYRMSRAIDIPYTECQKWYNDIVHSIDISDLSGMWYIFTAPFSWSLGTDYTIVKIKRVWLSN